MGRKKDKFPCISRNKQYAVLHTTEEYDFHIWNKNYTSRHSHDNYVEFFIVTQGAMLHSLNDTDAVLLQQGDAGIVMPNDIHQHLPYNDQTTSFINLTCSLPSAEKMLSLLHKKEIQSLRTNIIHLSPKQMDVVSAVVEQILIMPKQASALIPSLIAYVFGIFCFQEQNTEENPLPKWLQDFLSLLPTLDYETTKISDLYQYSNYSQSMLSVYFKKYVGMPLVEYVNNIKLNQACSLLEKTDFTTLDISNKIGFSSLAHFNHLFKKRFGQTPIQYRKLHQHST